MDVGKTFVARNEASHNIRATKITFNLFPVRNAHRLIKIKHVI
jgi:hypothetical protein